MSSLLFRGSKAEWTVNAIRFDDFITKNQINDCNFIKIDIEGGEYSLLPTLLSFLADNRPTLHLSLHPCFLYPQSNPRSPLAPVFWTALLSLASLWSTMKVQHNLRFYRSLYDQDGNPLSFVRSPKICRGNVAIVATDTKW